MCGIAGIVRKYGEVAERPMIEAMTSAVAHRGPDGSGIFIDKNLALGHRRLSIIDLSENSAQPMFFGDKYVIVFNGEIYNYVELRNELKILGYTFKTTGDTEVILAAYDFWKENCVTHFNGMWAFCIYDKTADKLFCSRDRFGVKPFYYSTYDGFFKFGSEIRQLFSAGLPRIVNKKVLSDYLVLGLEEYNEETFFQHILKLNPGHNMFVDLKSGAISIAKYYTIKIDSAISSLSLEDASDLYLKELTRSVSYRLRSDVKVGTCLSGGLDSSAVAALASELYHQNSTGRFTAITAASVDPTNDEKHFAAQVVKQFDLSWATTTPTKDDFINSMDEVILTQEEPFGSPSIFMQYFVMQKAQEAGCPVLLDGQGGDESLIGYQRYYPSYINSLPISERLGGIFKSSANSGLTAVHLMKSYLYFTNAEVRIRRQLNRTNFLNSSFSSLINRDLVRSMAESYKDIRELQKIEITATQLPHLLKYEDKNSMHFSIETRLPFLDYRLLETSLSLNNHFKVRDGFTKYILRHATKHILPSSIGWRKNKIGFEAPSAVWLSDSEAMMKTIRSSSILNSISGKIPDLSNDRILLWKMYNVAKWEELFDVREN